MAKGKNTPNIAALVGQIRGIAGDLEDTSLIIDVGEIQQDKSLSCNTFDVPVPKDDYMICRSAIIGELTTSSADDHTHQVQMPKLKAGDKVLVAWVGNDPIVIDVLVNAEDVL